MNEAIYEPINVLTDLCGQLAQKQVEFTASNLTNIFSQLQASVGATLDLASKELEKATSEWDNGMAEDDADEMTSDQASAYAELNQELGRSRTEMQECLQMARDTFLNARSLQDFQSKSGYLMLVQSRMDNSLRRLDSTLLMSKHPEQVGRKPHAASEQVGEALTHTAEALEHLSEYMKSGKLDSIDLALSALDRAREPLNDAVKDRNRFSYFMES